MDFAIVDYLTNPVTEEELLYAGIMFSWSDGNNIVQQSDDHNYMIDVNLSNDEGRPIDNGIVEEIHDDEWIDNLLNDEDLQIDNGFDKELVVESNDYMIENLGNDEGRPINNGTVEESFNEWIANFVNDEDLHIDYGIGEELVEEGFEWVKILLDDDELPIENGIDKKFGEESKDYVIKNLGNDEDNPIEISSDENFVKESNEYVIKKPVTEEELQDAGIMFRWNGDDNTVQLSDDQNHMINNLPNDESRPLDNVIVEDSSDVWINNHLNDEDLPIDNSIDRKFVEESNDYMIKNLVNDEDRPIEISSDKNLVEESNEYMIKNLVNEEDRPIEYGGDENLVEESIEFVVNNLPPGFRFRPKDEELIRDFLAKKICSMPLPPSIIQEVQLYNHHPRDICQNHELIQANEWYFFTLTQKKYSNGTRPNRTIGGSNGFWRAAGSDVKIKTGQHEIGLKKQLVYYEGKAKDRNGGKTNWIMHEYCINETTSQIAIPSTRSNSSDTMIDYNWVLCRIYHRQTSKPKPKDNEEASRFSESFDIEN